MLKNIMLKEKKDAYNISRTDKFLKERQENVLETDDAGHTTLMVALMYNVPCYKVKELIDNGSDVNAIDIKGNTVLLLALEHNKIIKNYVS